MIYIACEDMNLDWKESEVESFRVLWEQGYSIQFIADHFGRESDEVGILVIDQARKGMIIRRKNGAYGG